MGLVILWLRKDGSSNVMQQVEVKRKRKTILETMMRNELAGYTDVRTIMILKRAAYQ